MKFTIFFPGVEIVWSALDKILFSIFRNEKRGIQIILENGLNMIKYGMS